MMFLDAPTKRILFLVLASLALGPAASAQEAGGTLEVKVSLDVKNVVSTVDAVAVECGVQSNLVVGNPIIGVGMSVLFFENLDDMSVFDPQADPETANVDVTAASRDAIPSEVTVNVHAIGQAPIDAWTSGDCTIWLLEPFPYDPKDIWLIDSYNVPKLCENVSINELYRCAVPGSGSSFHSSFTRPGFEAGESD